MIRTLAKTLLAAAAAVFVSAETAHAQSGDYGYRGYDVQRVNPGGQGYLLDFQNRGRPVDRYSFTQPWYGGSGYGTTRYGHRNRGGYDYSTPAYYANPRSGYSLYVR